MCIAQNSEVKLPCGSECRYFSLMAAFTGVPVSDTILSNYLNNCSVLTISEKGT
jgi:hypothetical protein